MASLKKIFDKHAEEKPVELVEKQATPESGKCACGEPVAKELGQSEVCKKHIRIG